MMPESVRLLFSSGEATLALAKQNRISAVRYGRGLAPALEIFEKQPNLLAGAEVYDLIVGKAAASVFILGEACYVYGFTMSRSAADLLAAYGVSFGCQTLADEILNRSGTGPHPLEQSLLRCTTPDDCLPIIYAALAQPHRQAT